MHSSAAFAGGTVDLFHLSSHEIGLMTGAINAFRLYNICDLCLKSSLLGKHETCVAG